MAEEDLHPSRSYNLEPDFNRPLYRLPQSTRADILDKLVFLYGESRARRCIREIERIAAVFHAHKTQEMIEHEESHRKEELFNEKDVVLITYGDLIKEENRRPLQTLIDISSDYFFSVFFNTIHILPFFPSSSDRGFAIRDFREVDPDLGTWDDIGDLRYHFKLMFDGVFNHVSSKSYWFQEFLNGNPEYRDFFHSFPERRKISKKKIEMLLRPRTTSVFTKFRTFSGNRLVWTTFSADQIDLNFKNPRVLLNIIDVLLFYVRKGADIIRLDAATYLWRQLGTPSAHLRQTHAIIKIFRAILDAVAPHVAMITETNVPHEDNLAYFGNGSDEAHMVYNFALPPLILHTFHTGDAGTMTRWAAGLENPSRTATFFNFFDSHDGIGVMGATGILDESEIRFIADRAIEHGGLVSYRKEKSGAERIYELNITSYNALNRTDSGESIELQVRRYIAARSIILIISGVPGIYIHGLLGSRNYLDDLRTGSDNRSINRHILSKQELLGALLDKKNPSHIVMNRLARMIHMRTREKAFHPHAGQVVLDLGPRIFGIARHSLDGASTVIALTNVTAERQRCEIDLQALRLDAGRWRDILSGKKTSAKKGRLSFSMRPYEVLWLKNADAERL